MRMIGHLNGEAQARNFRDFLFVQGIDNQIENDKDGNWSVWVHSEEDLDRAKMMLAEFQANPADAKFQNHGQTAEELREQRREEQAAYEKRVKQRRHLFRPFTAYGFGPVSFIMIFISVVVFVGQMTREQEVDNALKLTRFDIKNADDLSIWQGLRARITNIHEILPEIRSGKVWRLITPIFLHFGIMHIFFNMLWLRDLGSMVEGRQGSAWFVVLAVVFAVISNLTQYFFAGGDFGGMSGVVYGLIGYIWIRGKLDPGSGLYLHATTVTMMIIWFFVCLVGIMGPIANAAHAAGLLTGMAWGAISSLRHR